MFITGGRAGQVMYFAMLLVLSFQLHKSIFKAILVYIAVFLVIFSISYSTSEIFKTRVDLATLEIIDYKNNKTSSTGLRITTAIHSWDIIKNNPLIGVGTGDYRKEIIAASKKNNDPDMARSSMSYNPHNMYVLILVQFGLLGLISLLYIFYNQIKIAINSNDDFIRKAGVTLPILYLLIMLSDSYLMVHTTGLLFVFLSSFIYKNYRAN